jgi:hypothetical protein
MSINFYDQFFAEPMAERQRIAQAAGLSLAYIHKHTYVQQREPKFHFHNAVGLDRASNGKLCVIDMTEGDIDWTYVLQRLKELQKDGRIAKAKIKPLATAHFDDFWAMYPRKVGKPAALTKWNSAKGDANVDAIKKDLARRVIHDEQWTRDGGRFIPNPATYLHQRRWEDETVTLQEANTGAFAGAL